MEIAIYMEIFWFYFTRKVTKIFLIFFVDLFMNQFLSSYYNYVLFAIIVFNGIFPLYNNSIFFVALFEFVLLHIISSQSILLHIYEKNNVYNIHGWNGFNTYTKIYFCTAFIWEFLFYSNRKCNVFVSFLILHSFPFLQKSSAHNEK